MIGAALAPDGVRLEGLSKRYPVRGGALDAVSGIDLITPKGDFVTRLEPSSCGKSTVLRMLAGLDDAAEGDAR